jgi:hypothetical protein
MRLFVSSMSTNTLGFVMDRVVIPILGFFVATLIAFLIARRRRKSFQDSFFDSLFIASAVAIVLVSLWSATFVWNVVRTIYGSHTAVVDERDKLERINTQLSSDLEARRQFPDPDEPAFANIGFVLQAFESYGTEMKGKPCVLWFTAPPDSLPMAHAIAVLW